MARNSQIGTPHFAFPFTLLASGKSAVYTEQDSDDEIMDSVQVFLTTERGERIEVPDYGIPDQTFLQNGVNTNQILTALGLWEPRADIDITSTEWTQLVQRVRFSLKGRDA